MKAVRIAILGMNQGYKFAKDAIQLPGVELVAVAGINELAEARAKELNVPLYHDYKELLRSCSLDGVIISLPNQLHREAVEECAIRGLHVLVEKPIASTLEDGEAIIECCRKYNVKLLVGHHRRFSSKMLKLKEIISSGVLGDIVGVNMLWVLAKDRPYYNEKWRISPGGGPLLINGIHDIDNILFATGAKITSLFAYMRNSIRNHPVEDSASIIMETSEGATINYYISDGVPSPWNYEFDVRENPRYKKSNENCYTLFGTKASLAFPTFTMYSYDEERYGWEHELKAESFEVPDNDPMTDELKHFIAILRGEAEPFVTGEAAYETLRVITAIRESAELGTKVALS